MAEEPTPLAQRLHEVAFSLIGESLVSLADQKARLEELAVEVRQVADHLIEHVEQTRQVYDLFAALVLGMNKTFRPEAPVDDEFSFVLVASEAISEVSERWQVQIDDHPGGYALRIVSRLADSIEKGDRHGASEA